MHRSIAASLALAVSVILSGCTLSRPHYVPPDVHNGEPIFPAMLAALRGARTTITFANFIYEDGDIAARMADALAERCRAGVKAHVLLDAVGSSQMPRRLWTEMENAGCEVAWFHPPNPFAIKRINHRNHRRILVVDGRVGFTGGTGVGEQWTGDGRQPDHWRQTDVRVEGPIVRSLQAAFAENWRDATGTLLGGDAYFPDLPARGALAIQSVKSSPASGAAEAYLLFRLAIDGARSSIYLTNPYFVPDEAMADALVNAARRGVHVSIITAGVAQGVLDRLVRQASRAHFPRASRAGIKIYEYGPALH